MADGQTSGHARANVPLASVLLARPLVWLAGGLGCGTHLGLRIAEGAGLAAGACLLGLALALLVLARRGAAPAWATAAVLLAALRASALGEPRSALLPTALEARELRSAPILGRWRARHDGRMGWVEPFAGHAPSPGHALLLEPRGPAPLDGTPVAILPGSEVLPWARGPAPGKETRAGRFAALSPVAPDELVRLGPAPRSLPFAAALAALREAVGERVARVEGPRSAGLLQALSTGERGRMSAERIELFARTGTSHLLAISGWHVGLFAAVVLLPLARAAPRARRSPVAIAARLGLLVVFAAVAGAEKPVLRATLAVALLQLAALRGRAGAPPRRPDALSSLGAAFALECLLDPRGIRSLSLALSYAATLGLVLGMGPLARGLRPARARWVELGADRPARVVAERLRAALASGLAASAAAVLATLPLTWCIFGEFAPAGVVITLLALAPFAFLSLLAWLAALVPWSGLMAPAELGARALYALLELGDALPGTPLLLPPRPLPALAGATALVFLGLSRPRARRPAALAWGFLLLPWCAAPSGLELVALDVGHGTAVVLRAPGLEALVFDAGSRDRRAVAGEALLPLLARWEAGTASVVLSHPHQDHSAGLERLSQRLEIRAWLGAEPAQGLVLRPHGLGPLDPSRGRLAWTMPCPELSLAVLRGADDPGNEGSRALEVHWRGERLLLLGDAEEAGLWGLPLPPGPLRLLLAPHHGSDAAALAPLLERAPPEEVWISASLDPPIAAELDRRGLRWRWTGRDGPLALRLR
jgi:competence protein ComEC